MRHHSNPPSSVNYEIDVDSMTVSLSRTNLFPGKPYSLSQPHSLSQAHSRSGSMAGKMSGILEENAHDARGNLLSDPFAYESDSVFSEEIAVGSDFQKYGRNEGDYLDVVSHNKLRQTRSNPVEGKELFTEGSCEKSKSKRSSLDSPVNTPLKALNKHKYLEQRTQSWPLFEKALLKAMVTKSKTEQFNPKAGQKRLPYEGALNLKKSYDSGIDFEDSGPGDHCSGHETINPLGNPMTANDRLEHSLGNPTRSSDKLEHSPGKYGHFEQSWQEKIEGKVTRGIDKVSSSFAPEESGDKGLPRRSSTVLLLGATGCGKSTLLNQFLISAECK